MLKIHCAPSADQRNALSAAVDVVRCRGDAAQAA
jgi:hypothetical protein